ncbi:redoxin domain-containing protein [bacterium]|nr:MAG: redoxin domain-containing protein [bacterium]
MRTYSHISRDTALASYAAWDQGKFWEMHDLLFENAPELDRDVIDSLARKLNLDMDRFKKSMENMEHLDELQGNLDRVHDLDVWSTPTVIINGTMIKGAQPYENYKREVDKALKELSALESFDSLKAIFLGLIQPSAAYADGGAFGQGQVPLWVPAPKMKPTNDIRVGQEAPDFTLPSVLGKEITLSDFRGEKNVLISFLPAAFTPT